jgi:uncharacterized protein YbjT (DUF2867 family)
MAGSIGLSILITGATGNIGKELTRELSAKKIPFRAMVRAGKDARAIAELQGIEIVNGDFNDTKSLVDALGGRGPGFSVN